MPNARRIRLPVRGSRTGRHRSGRRWLQKTNRPRNESGREIVEMSEGYSGNGCVSDKRCSRLARTRE